MRVRHRRDACAYAIAATHRNINKTNSLRQQAYSSGTSSSPSLICCMMSIGASPLTVQPTEKAVPSISKTALELAGHRSRSHGSSDLDDLIQRDVAVVLDVLLLLAVADGLVEGLDDEGRRGGNHFYRRLAVDDRQLNSDVHALPVHGRLLDVLADLLRAQAEGADLRR